MKFIEDIEGLSGKRVLLRVDFNVPIEAGKVKDDFRIRKILPTIEYFKTAGAKTILIAHLENEADDSLLPVYEHIKNILPVSFVENFTTPEGKETLSKMQNGDVIMLQNIRHFPGEKNNDPAFAKELSTLGDIYVNDAFSVSHRPHASIIGVPKFLPHYMGELFRNEVKNLSRAFTPPHPFLFILAGAKFETKLPLVQKFLALAETVFIGGALANDLFKIEGYEVGASSVSPVSVDLSPVLQNPKLMLPVDVVLEDKRIVSVTELAKSDKVMDVGPKSTGMLSQAIEKAKFILWNGTLGICENGFVDGTQSVAKAIISSHAQAVVGGGDTLAALDPLKIFDKFSFVSSGGGAMLEFLASETLPGIEALK